MVETLSRVQMHIGSNPLWIEEPPYEDGAAQARRVGTKHEHTRAGRSTAKVHRGAAATGHTQSAKVPECLKYMYLLGTCAVCMCPGGRM